MLFEMDLTRLSLDSVEDTEDALVDMPLWCLDVLDAGNPLDKIASGKATTARRTRRWRRRGS